MSTSSALSQIGVFTAPGAMMMTSIPNSISSRRRLSDSPSIACLEADGIGLFAYAAEHAKAAVEQQLGAGPADAGGRAGDDNRSHDLEPLVRGLMKFVVKECLSARFVSFLRGYGQP